MRDEISFRSLKIKSDNTEEKVENFSEEKKNQSLSNNNNNNNSSINYTPPKSNSKKEKVKSKIKEYFKKENQLHRKDFDSFLSFIGLRDIWSKEEEQEFLWRYIENKAKDKENIDYEATLEGICELFEDDEDNLIDINEKNNKSFSINDNISNNDINDLDNLNYENCIDEYLNSIKDNVGLMFAIKFINEIFLINYINDSINIKSSFKTFNIEQENENGLCYNRNKNNNNNIEEEIEITQFENKINKKTFINITDILNEIKTKYRFIMINSEELNSYFNNLSKNKYSSRKSVNSYNIIIKYENNQEYCLDKELITYVNTMVVMKLNSKIKEEDKNGKKDDDNNILKNIDNNDNEKIIEKLTEIDFAISDMFNIIINNNNSNIELEKIFIMFNSNYLIPKKNYLYNKLQKIINETKHKLDTNKSDETESQININEINISNNKLNIVKENDNYYLKQQIENLKERNDNLLKENKDLKAKLSKEKKEIILKNGKKMNKLDISKTKIYNSSSNSNPNLNSKNYISSRYPEHIRNKTVGDENNIYIMLNQKNNSNNDGCNTYRNPIINHISRCNNSNPNISNDTNNGKTIRGNKSSSFYEYNVEELTNSKIDLFSIGGNNNVNENFLLETSGLGNEPGTPTLTPRSKGLDNNDENLFGFGELHDMRLGSKISAISNNKENYNNSNRNNDGNNMMINFNKKKKMSFGINTELYNTENDNDTDTNNYLYRFDFKYLSLNKKIARLLLHNNEKLISYEIFSDQINYIYNGQKKRQGNLLITSQCFYILDDTPEMNCILRISHKLLSSISISKNNFNHLLISFNEGSFIIIEIFSRIHLLNYLKELYNKYKYKKININITENFYVKLKNNCFYTYDLKNRKDIISTPNFENAQKIGVLLKYHENFFSAYFDEKIVVLTSVGLMAFDKDNFNKPLVIIPLIGSAIKHITANNKEKLYCFKIKTSNNENFIFASNKNNEIKDWMKEIKKYTKLYESRLNDIISEFITK